jgi:hypothetical protein
VTVDQVKFMSRVSVDHRDWRAQDMLPGTGLRVACPSFRHRTQASYHGPREANLSAARKRASTDGKQVVTGVDGNLDYAEDFDRASNGAEKDNPEMYRVRSENQARLAAVRDVVRGALEAAQCREIRSGPTPRASPDKSHDFGGS